MSTSKSPREDAKRPRPGELRRMNITKISRLDETRCVVACLNASGSPDFFFVGVICSREQREAGLHYAAAKDAARAEGYGGDMVVYDPDDGFAWLFNRFEWRTASVVHI